MGRPAVELRTHGARAKTQDRNLSLSGLTLNLTYKIVHLTRYELGKFLSEAVILTQVVEPAT